MTPRAGSVSVSVPTTPDKVGLPRKQSPLGNEFLGPFCRCAHGVTGRGRVSENGAGGQASGETTGFGGAFLGTDRATVGSAPSDHLWLLPAFPTDTDWRVNPRHTCVQSCHGHMAYQCQLRGVPWEGPPPPPSHPQHCLTAKCE